MSLNFFLVRILTWKAKRIIFFSRFTVLDARLHLLTAKNVDIKHAVSTKGVCLDMCPEKEHLMREAKYQVALFEFEIGSKTIMNHSKAMK